MKGGLSLLFLMFSFILSCAQTRFDNKKWGTIKVQKIRSQQTLAKHMAKKRSGIRVFWGRNSYGDYKETFPASYQSQLFPLVFNGGGLILTDENKQKSRNTVRGYDYEIFIGNVTAFKVKSVTAWDLNSRIRSLKRGEYMWITKLYYTDVEGNIHSNEIGEFKVEKVR